MSTARQNNSPSKEEGRKHKIKWQITKNKSTQRAQTSGNQAVKEEDNSVNEESSEMSSDEGTSGQPIKQDLTDLAEMILMRGTSLETDTLNLTTKYHKDLVRFKEMLEERENQHVQAERCINGLKSALGEKEEELRIVAQKYQRSEASLDVIMRHRNDLEEEKARLFKDLVEFRGKLEKSENQHVQDVGRIKSLESSLDEKEQELRIVVQKHQMSEASLEASMRHHNDLEEEKTRLFKDLVEFRGKLEKSEDQRVQAEGCIKSLKSSLDEKEQELRIVAQKHQMSEASLVTLGGKLEKSEDQRVQAVGRIQSLESSLDEKEEELRIVAKKHQMSEASLEGRIKSLESSLNEKEQELKIVVQKHQMSEASLEASLRHHNDLEEEKTRLFKDLAEFRGKLEKSEDQRVQAEGCIKSLESSLDEKEQELKIVAQKHQMSEASLEASLRHHNDLEEEKTRLLKDLAEFRGKLEKSEDQRVQAEGRIKSLESSLDEKEQELKIVAQKHQMSEASLEGRIKSLESSLNEKEEELRTVAQKHQMSEASLEGRIKSLESSLNEKEEELRMVAQKHQMSESSLEGHIKSLESSLDEKEQELKIVAQKHQMSEASLEASLRHHNDLEEEKTRLFKDLAEFRGKLEKSENQRVQAEGRIKSLESSLDEKEEELKIVAQKHRMSEASLKANMHNRNDLEEDEVRLFKDLVELREKLETSEDQQAEGRIKSLKNSLDEKEHEPSIVNQKHQMSKASLEANMRYHNNLEEEKDLLLDELRRKLEKSEDQRAQAEGRIKSLKRSLDEKEEELSIGTQKHQRRTELEEAVQRLKIENARLKAAAKQQSNKMYALQKGAQELSTDKGWLEDMAANLNSSKQKQVLKSCSRVGLPLGEHEKNTEMEIEKKKVEKIAEQKRRVDGWLDDEMKMNTELKKDNYMLRSLLKTAKKKLRDQDTDRHRQADSAFGQMKKKVDNLEAQLQTEWSHCSQLEKVNSDLKDQLTSLDTMSHLNDQLKRSKRQLEEEVLDLRYQIEAAQMEHSQVELYIERRANQKLQQKLEEINIALQSQAASNKAFDTIKAANEANLRFQLEQKIQDLEGKLDQVTTTYHDNINRRDSICTELERYRQLYTDEMHLRKSLAGKLERANSRLEDTSHKGHNKRNLSLITCNIPDRSLGGPLLNVELFGLNGAPPQEPLPGNLSRHSSGTNRQSSRVEDYHTEMQRNWDRNTIIHHSCSTAYSFRGYGGLEPIPAALGEGGVHPGQDASPLQLDRNTSKELNNARAELDFVSVCETPVASASRVELYPIAEQCSSS